MSKRYRVILEQGEYRIPIESLRMAEDIQTLELVLKLLGGLDRSTISDDFATVTHLKTILHAAKRSAQFKLKTEYLSGKRCDVSRPREVSLKDAWESVIEHIRSIAHHSKEGENNLK